MISVLIPSRERPELAKQAIDSFGGHQGFEFIVALDDDDTSDYTEVEKLATVISLRNTSGSDSSLASSLKFSNQSPSEALAIAFIYFSRCL